MRVRGKGGRYKENKRMRRRTEGAIYAREDRRMREIGDRPKKRKRRAKEDRQSRRYQYYSEGVRKDEERESDIR